MKPVLYVLLLAFAAPIIVFSQDGKASNGLSVEEYLSLATKNKHSGDIKEATRYLNAAAMKVWEAKSYDKAIQYFNESIELNKQINNASGIAKLNSNLGMIYSDLREFEKSLSYFQLSLDYRLVHGEKSEIISTYINKSVVLNSLKRYDEAAVNLEESLRLATEMSDATQMKSCYGMLAETYEKAGNQEKTIYYFNLYRTFHEMVQRNKVADAKKETEAAKLLALQAELEKREKELLLLSTSRELKETESELQNMSAEMRTLIEGKTKQQLAISLLERELELDQLRIAETEAKNNSQKIWMSVIVAGSLLSFAIAFLFFRNYRYKKKINQQLSEQNNEIKALNESLEAQVVKRTAELQKTLANLEKRNRDLDQFSHVISHNLRGPVANILGLGKVINRVDHADPINFEVIARLLDATQNLDAVVKDLSVILSVQDNQSIPRETVNIGEAVDAVKNLLLTEIQKSRMQISMENNGTTKILIVKPYFESIVYNLLSNAIKYRSQERDPIVRLKSTVKDGKFSFIVTDNGTGIENGDLDRIFEPYKRLTLDGDGKGLGLYMVRTQVEAMGGTIEVSSEKGKGSCFSIHVPQSI